MSKIRKNIEYYRVPDEIETDIGEDNIATKFGNANRIIGDVIVYVSLTGNDTTAVIGDANLPFLTIQAAIDAIKTYIIDSDANITIQIGAGKSNAIFSLSYIDRCATGIITTQGSSTTFFSSNIRNCTIGTLTIWASFSLLEDTSFSNCETSMRLLYNSTINNTGIDSVGGITIVDADASSVAYPTSA